MLKEQKAYHDKKRSYTWKLFSSCVAITNYCPVMQEGLNLGCTESPPQCLSSNVSTSSHIWYERSFYWYSGSYHFFLNWKCSNTISQPLRHFFFSPNLWNTFAMSTNPLPEEKSPTETACLPVSRGEPILHNYFLFIKGNILPHISPLVSPAGIGRVLQK